MDLSQQRKARKTAVSLMRLSAERTGTIDELLLVETARFMIQQADLVKGLQDELETLNGEVSPHTHRQSLFAEDDYEPFLWSCSPLAKLIEDTAHPH